MSMTTILNLLLYESCLRSTIVSLKYDKPMCEPEGGNLKSLTHGQSADDKKDQQDDKEAEIADEEEEFGGDGEQNTPPVLYSTKRRPLSTVGEKAHMKRPIKRRHLSSPFPAESQAPPLANFYRVRWRSTWLPKSALGNAQALLRDFEAES